MKFTILRTAVGSSASVFAIRAIKAIPDIRVVVADVHPLSVGFHFADAHYLVPKVNDPDFISSIIDICQREQVNCILPTLEEEILEFAIAKSKFDAYGISIPIPSIDSIKICCDKYLSYQFFNQHNLPTPKTSLAADISKLTENKYIIKPRQGRGSKDVYQVNDMVETRFFSSYVRNAIIQEYINGKEYSIDTLANLDGKFLYCVVRERIATESGISSKGRIIRDLQLEDLAQKVVNLLKLVGATCMQVIVTPDGIPFIIEINLRVGGGAALSLAAGVPIIVDLVNIAKGEATVGIKNLKNNLVMLRYWEEVFVESEI